MRSRCSYAYLFETPPPPGSEKMRRYPAAPHPFVLDPRGWTSDPSSTTPLFEIRITLIGSGMAELNNVVEAMREAGRQGIGPDRAPFELVEVAAEAEAGNGNWQPMATTAPTPVTPLPPAPDSRCIRVRLETPLRVKRREALVTPSGFGLGDLFAPLLRRVSLLSYFHTAQPLETDFAGLNTLARERPRHVYFSA
ncbi:MAG: CRISPR-associated protein Cas6, partial [Thiohalorhabdaceae bacterium]